MARGIFVDILPRLEANALAAVMTQITSIFGRAGKEMGGSMAAATREVAALQAAMISAGNAAEAAAIKAEAMEAKVAAAQRRLVRANEAAAAATTPGMAGRAADRQAAALDAVAIGTRRHALAQKEASEAGERAEAISGKYSDAMERAAIAGGGFASTMNTVGKAVTGVTAIMGGIAVNNAKNFEYALQRVGSASDVPAAQLKVLHDGLLNLTATYGTSMSELTNGARVLQRSGGIFKDAASDVRVLNTALQASIMDQVPVADVLEAAAGSANNFSLSVDQTIDQIAKLKAVGGDFMTGTIGDLSRAMGVSEPFAALAMGHSSSSADQLLTMLVQLAHQNVTPQNSADIAKNAMRSLAAPNNQQAQWLGGLLGTISNPQTGKPMTLSDFQSNLRHPEAPGGGILGALETIGTVLNKNTVMGGPNGDTEMVRMPVFQTNEALLANLNRARGAMRNPVEQQLISAMIDNLVSPLDDSQLKALRTKIREHKTASPEFSQAVAMFNRAGGFSPALRGAIDSEQMTPNQVIQKLTGTSLTMQAFESAFGTPEAAAQTQAELEKVRGAKAGPDGSLEGWGAVADTLQQKMHTLNGQLQKLSITAGEQLLPAFSHIVEKLQSMLEFFNRHQTAVSNILKVCTDISLVWGASKILGGIAKASMKLGDMFGVLTKSKTEAAAIGTSLETGIASSTSRSMGMLGRLGGMLANLKSIAGSIMIGAGMNSMLNAGPGGPNWFNVLGQGGIGAGLLMGGPAGWGVAAAGGAIMAGGAAYHAARGVGGPDAHGLSAYQPNNPTTPLGNALFGSPDDEAPAPTIFGDADGSNVIDTSTLPLTPKGKNDNNDVLNPDQPLFGPDQMLPYDDSILGGGGGAGGGGTGDVDAASLPGYINPADYSTPIGAEGVPAGGGSVPLMQNADGTWTSPDPAWAHLIQRESGGRNVRQQIIDSNSGGNEAEGLFQITPATWRSHGGTEFAPSALSATPQQQADIAARILRANPSGSDWGAGLPGRENANALMAGLTGAPAGTAADPYYFLPAQGFPGLGGGGVNMNYTGPGGGNPLLGAMSGGPMQGMAKMMTMFFANLALGNPIGFGATGQMSPYAWWYQGPGAPGQQGGMSPETQSLQGLNKEQLENVKNTNALKLAYMQLNEAMASGNPDKIAKAQMHLQNVQAGQMLKGRSTGDVDSWNNALKRYHSHPTEENWNKLRAMSNETGFPMPEKSALAGGAPVSSSSAGSEALPFPSGAIGGSPQIAQPGRAATPGGGGGLNIPAPSIDLNATPAPTGAAGPTPEKDLPFPFGGGGKSGPGAGGHVGIQAGPLPGAATRGEGMMPRATTQPGAMMKQPKGSPIGGGLIGAAESAAVAAAGMTPAGPAGSMAAQLAMQEANLAVGKIGDIAANLLVNMPLETFTLHGPEGKSGDLSRTLPFRVLGSFMESHPNLPNTAGQNGPSETQAPKAQQKGQGVSQERQSGPGVNIENQNFYGDQNHNQVNQSIAQAQMSPSFVSRGA